MSREQSTPVLIVGAGAGGSTLAYALALAGIDALVLERGPRHARAEFVHDELAGQQVRGFIPDPLRDPHIVATHDNPAGIASTLGWTALGAGGGTLRWSGYFYRFHPIDFRMASAFPSDPNLADWPIDYPSLAPYYRQAERLVGTSGERDRSRFAPPVDEPLPMPPRQQNSWAARLRAAGDADGLALHATPRAINSIAYGGRPACAYCQRCGSYGCPNGARGGSHETLLAAAERTGRVRILSEHRALEIETDSRGRAVAAIVAGPDGDRLRIRADVVCLACSTVETARLLLLSRSARFPNGLGNSTGQVGRHLQFHGVSMLRAYFPKVDGPRHEPGRVLDLSSSAHYLLDDDASSTRKGGLLRFALTPPSPILDAKHLAMSGPRVRFGDELLSAYRERHLERSAVEVEAFHDYFPNPGTRVELDPERLDSLGQPCARIWLDPSPRHAEIGDSLLTAAERVLQRAGADFIERSVVGGTSSYLVYGACRAGHSPEHSVVDGDGRCHEIDNLYVVDGSYMPTSGGVAPTLTLIANALRIGERLAARLRGHCEPGMAGG